MAASDLGSRKCFTSKIGQVVLLVTEEEEEVKPREAISVFWHLLTRQGREYICSQTDWWLMLQCNFMLHKESSA